MRVRSIPRGLIFEVTETAAVTNITHAQAFAQQLRDRGCRFALDGFGAGFGSFYYLKHLPFDYVKIDGEFVQHATSGHIDQLVIEAVVRIAQGLGNETIAVVGHRGALLIEPAWFRACRANRLRSMDCYRIASRRNDILGARGRRWRSCKSRSATDVFGARGSGQGVGRND